MPKSEARDELLKELAAHVTPGLLSRFANTSTDEQIRDFIADAKIQRAAHDAVDAAYARRQAG